MKLKHVLKGHIQDKQVRVVSRYGAGIEWSGKSMTHMIKRYRPEYLEKEVVNTTKTYYGLTIIKLA